MRIALAQIKPLVGDIQNNIIIHKEFILKAVQKSADLVIFPELSITAYEPKIAKQLQLSINDELFNDFQDLADKNNICICIGFPEITNTKPKISLGIFQKNENRKSYSKQFLHDDEKPYFSEGNKQEFIKLNNKLIALGICYESSLKEHHELAFSKKIDLYLVSVAKHLDGINNSKKMMQKLAFDKNIFIAMVNALGVSDGFINAGNSFAINKNGENICRLESEENLLIVDI